MPGKKTAGKKIKKTCLTAGWARAGWYAAVAEKWKRLLQTAVVNRLFV
jgi:hypothetical protein